eukprot:3244960-Pleurochrysis_carterae.AAC.1
MLDVLTLRSKEMERRRSALPHAGAGAPRAAAAAAYTQRPKPTNARAETRRREGADSNGRRIRSKAVCGWQGHQEQRSLL